MKGLTAQAAGYHQMGPILTAEVLLPQQTHGDLSASYCCVRASSRVLTSKIRDRPQSITFDKPFGGRKRGQDRVMGLDWGFMESTHHTARTVESSSESCTRRSNGAPRQVSCRCCPSLNLMVVRSCPYCCFSAYLRATQEKGGVGIWEVEFWGNPVTKRGHQL